MKKRMLMFAAIVAAVIGLIVMNIEIEEEPPIQEVEEMSVKALKKTFREIESVEFLYTDYNKKTGFYRTAVKMTSQNNQTVEFDFSFNIDDPTRIGAWKVVDEENVQMAGETTSQVSVTYSDGSIGVV